MSDRHKMMHPEENKKMKRIVVSVWIYLHSIPACIIHILKCRIRLNLIMWDEQIIPRFFTVLLRIF